MRVKSVLFFGAFVLAVGACSQTEQPPQSSTSTSVTDATPPSTSTVGDYLYDSTERYVRFGVSFPILTGFEVVLEPNEVTVSGGLVMMSRGSAESGSLQVVGVGLLARPLRVLSRTSADMLDLTLASEPKNPDIEVGAKGETEFRGEILAFQPMTSFERSGPSGLGLALRTDQCETDLSFFVLDSDADDPMALLEPMLEYLESPNATAPAAHALD